MEQFYVPADSVNIGHSSHYPHDTGLIALFLQQVDINPQHPAIITADQTISYSELARRAHALAAGLREKNLRAEQPVAILLPPGIEQIICQIAILWAGGSCVPLDPTLPEQRLRYMLQDLHISLIITNRQSQQAWFTAESLLLENIPDHSTDSPLLRCDDGQLTHRAYLLFTSGSTGQAKAVEIEARGIIRLVVDSQYVVITANDRMAAIANPSFDASLFEIWGALLNGAAMVLIAKETIGDPWRFETALQQYSVSIMFITTARFTLLTATCPRAFRYMNTLLVGGEVINPATLNKVLEAGSPRRLLAVYGPTECTVFALYHDLTHSAPLTGEVPLGLPVNNTSAFILDNQLQPVAPGATGRIWLGGEGLARGYWQRPEINMRKFIIADIASSGQSLRLYDSGDLGWQRSDGVFMFAGRSDNQIKIRGYRVEIEEVEFQLLESRLLQAAAVCVVKKTGAEPQLVAFIVPDCPDGFSKTDIERWIIQRLPDYMLPRMQVVSQLPLTPNGKIDRLCLLSELAGKNCGAPW
ncbi:amino acid adenylation domain-containing protein [Erwiniaceae bacterium BAC15a-03b]|uniref:Amino acid adenylation domain-containing protein n=1 Tax=Winslowiella arboricola TaxID=2978220 RepID=A0A9J6PS91_9GAMM|nr:amino acid adenylation domain-containing protein [Winslowiella arboricola]MCU5775576.1 amino acid adenylation domain-containing protein [Winslowiella arboricola]MCU5779574.1 amino acid adenylation domain-containing protein [Winslowiella arboricola]